MHAIYFANRLPPLIDVGTFDVATCIDHSPFENDGDTRSVKEPIVAPAPAGGCKEGTRSAPIREDSDNTTPDLPVHRRIFEESRSADSHPLGQYGDSLRNIGPRYIAYNGGSYRWLDGSISSSPSNSAANSTDNTESSQSSVEQIGVYTVVAFAALVAICISACAFYRCTRPCRAARKREKTVEERMQRRQTHDAVRANQRAREIRRRERRAQRAAVEAVTVEMLLQARESTRQFRNNSAVTFTEELRLGASAEAYVTRPESALHRRLSMAASLDMASDPATPLPRYEREDPLRRHQATVDPYHLERSPSYAEISSSWQIVETAHTQS
ncbi:MAG: hypothetical protein M1830_001593 [Pleopsidium flavum]|nr:MAG: hypothetical protein M1830_001593 [Pleopsidium flavum]